MTEDVGILSNVDMSSELFLECLVPSADTDSVPGSTPYRLLNVDDHPEATELTAELIEKRSPFEVISETSPTAAVERLETANHIDCILSDYDMPRQNGLELYHTVRDGHPHIPFVLCSNRLNEERRHKAITAGVTDVITKETLFTRQTVAVNRLKTFAIGYRHYRASTAHAARLRTLFEETTDCIVYGTVTNGRIIVRECNTAFEETFGVAQEAIVGVPLDRVLSSPRSSQRIVDQCRQMSGDETETTACRYVTAEGVTDFEQILAPIRQGSRTAGACVILSEVTTGEESS
jgi:PAS domain S-box-containing protein